MKRRWHSALLAAALAGCGGGSPADGPRIVAPAASTAAVAYDADDPAIWLHPSDPSRSLILGTDKRNSDGALVVFNLDGSVRQQIGGLDRPNNVDVEYGVALGAWRGDVAVLTERNRGRLRLFGIPADGGALVDLAPAGLPVLEGAAGDAGAPMGIGLYKRPADGALFAIVAPKAGPAEGYLAQYRIVADSAGNPAATLVRRFGRFSGSGEIEAVVVDDELGHVIVADELCCLRKYAADPDAPDAGRELARFGEDRFRGEREGLAIFASGPGRGFIVAADQIAGASIARLYRREGEAGDPHAHPEIGAVTTAADSTDGLDATAVALPGYAGGLLVMMNSGGRNFQLYRFDEFAAAARLAARNSASFSPMRISSPRGAGS